MHTTLYIATIMAVKTIVIKLLACLVFINITNGQSVGSTIQFKSIKIEDLVFDCRTTGDEKNELVILLHGFPETSSMWTALMEDISKSGFYCVAPNLRGYSAGARPKGKKNYTIDKLSQDVIDIANSFGQSKFHLVGHDWGACIGWKCVNDNLDKILSWTAMSVPHLTAFSDAINNDKAQRKMSSYIKAFNLPLLPEFIIRRKNFKILKETWVSSSKQEIEDYLKVFDSKQAVTAALNYYRGNYKFLKRAENTGLDNVTTPTLFIWGNKDAYVGSYGVEKGHQFMKGYYNFLELNTGHWLVQSKYKAVKTAILSHLKKFRQ